MERQSKGLDLQWKILIGIIAGIGIGMGINMAMGAGITSGILYVMKTVFQYGGDIFIRLLRMLIVPLVFASIFMAVANLGDVRTLGKIGGQNRRLLHADHGIGRSDGAYRGQHGQSRHRY